MNSSIFVIAEHIDNRLADITFEMLGQARKLADALGSEVTALLPGHGVARLADELLAADRVIVAEDELLAHFAPQPYQAVLCRVLEQHRPRLVMIGSTSMGLDLGACTAGKLGVTLVSSCRDILIDGDRMLFVSQMYGGKLMLEVEAPEETSIVHVLPGAFPMEDGKRGDSPIVEVYSSQLDPAAFGMRFETYIKPQAGDIDITQAPVIVSVGRGIQNQENLPVAEELAGLLGGAVASSRPIVDQDWLPVTRQVGKSGMIVKPRLYFALGISGAPEHVEGMKDAELIIGINTDPDAPIFNVAHYGVVGDIFDVVPQLTEKLREKRQ